MSERPAGEKRYRRFLRGFRGRQKDETHAYNYVGLGLTFALSILLFFGLGYKLDQYLGTLPLFALIGAFLGGVGGFIHLYRTVIRSSDRKPPNS